MNRLFRALADRLVAPLLLDQVTDAYARGWRDGVRGALDGEAHGRVIPPHTGRRVIGEEIHRAWSELGLTYLAARLREVQERTVGLVYTPSRPERSPAECRAAVDLVDALLEQGNRSPAAVAVADEVRRRFLTSRVFEYPSAGTPWTRPPGDKRPGRDA